MLHARSMSDSAAYTTAVELVSCVAVSQGLRTYLFDGPAPPIDRRIVTPKRTQQSQAYRLKFLTLKIEVVLVA